jgi:hypothetical protein
VDGKDTMFLRLLILTVLVILPRSSALAQDYSTGITAEFDLIPNVTYLELGAWQGKLDLYARADTLGPHPTLIFFHGGPMTGVHHSGSMAPSFSTASIGHGDSANLHITRM